MRRIPFPRIEHYKVIVHSGSTLWNSLPNNLKNTDSLYVFKSNMLKKVYFIKTNI